MSFQGLSKHIKILEQANLLQKEKQGKYRILSLNRDVLRSPLEWISFYSSFWNGSFDKLDDLIRKVNTDAKPK
jgi:DNA-binding transcriptional ArsR family regulator